MLIAVLGTNIGAKLCLNTTFLLIPGKIKAEAIEGSFLHGISLKNIVYYNKQNYSVQLTQLDFDLIAKIVAIKQAQITNKTQPNLQINLNYLNINFDYVKNRLWFNVEAIGKLNNEELMLNALFSSKQDSLTKLMVNSFNLRNSHNNIELSRYKDDFNINIAIQDLTALNLWGSLYATGKIRKLDSAPYLQLNLTSNNLMFKDVTLNNTKANIYLPLSLKSTEAIDVKLSIAQIKNSLAEANNFTLGINGDFSNNTLVVKHQYLEDNYSNTFINSINKNLLKINGGSDFLNLIAEIKLLNNENINGKIEFKLNNLNFIDALSSKFSRVNGQLESSIKLQGKINNPSFLSETYLSEVRATIPNLGIKIYPLNMRIVNNKQNKFYFEGYGKEKNGKGDFNFEGFLQSKNGLIENKLYFKASELEFIDINGKNLTASSELELEYTPQKKELNIVGNVDVEKGKIEFKPRPHQIVKSEDVVFVDDNPTTSEKKIAIKPNIYLNINNHVRFIGFNLNTAINGKLNITQENGALIGDGYISLKKGAFNLPGQTLYIEQGRLIYPAGTLLTNPCLDIKMSKITSADKHLNNQGIFIQGTTDSPIITENGISGGSDKAIAQVIAAGSGMMLPEDLTKILSFSEISIVEEGADEPDFFSDQIGDSFKNKNILVGKQLGRHFYVQYQRSLKEAKDSISLKWNLGQYLTLGVEHGTEGKGADVSFSIESD